MVSYLSPHSVRVISGFLLDSLTPKVGCSSFEPSRRSKLQCLSKVENKTPHLVIRRPVDTTSYDKALKQVRSYMNVQ